VGAAEVERGRIVVEMATFLAGHDALVTIVSQVPPFPVECEYPIEIDGVAMEGYLAWMRSCSRFSVTGCPAVSIPAGHTPDGLPVGIQVVTRWGTERRLLEVAATLEAVLAS
jgi:amidase